MEINDRVRGIAHNKNVAKITVLGVPDQPGIAAVIFEPLSDAGISVDTIVQNSGIENLADLTFTVRRENLQEALFIVQSISKKIHARDCFGNDGLGNVSIVGTGMQNYPGYASLMFRSLYEAGVNIEMITTSEIRITCIVDEDKVETAVRALHKAFNLDSIS
jgi:aspartate kinase